MNLQYTSRKYTPAEFRLLTTFKKRLEKESATKVKFYHFIIAAILGAGFTWIAASIPDSFWTFLTGTLAIGCFSFIVFTPYELYKLKRRHRSTLQAFELAISKGSVAVCTIRARQIALAKEYEDEGDLYIVEYELGKILYLWDTEYNLNKTFPCLEFELYEESFYKLIGRLLNPLSEKIKPVLIDRKAKWKYMKKYSVPTQLEMAEIDFDGLIDQFNACLKDN
jgi:hypothetical protein